MSIFTTPQKRTPGSLKRFNARATAVFLALVLLAAIPLASCTNASTSPSDASDTDTLKIVSTIYPHHDWVRQIVGDRAENVEMTLLVDQGVDLHSFQPTVADIATISSCDLFIYVGGESDFWVEEALANATNEDMIVIDLLEVLGSEVKIEETVEGMQQERGGSHDHAEEPADHDHENDEHAEDNTHDHDTEAHVEEGEPDEHVWLSLRNADILCAAITEQLCAIDPDHASTYQDNYRNYSRQLADLAAEYETAVRTATYDTLIFADRFPFRYLVDDLGLTYYAAFAGCSSETEASFETIVFLSEKLDELGLPGVVITESSDSALSETIVNNTSAKDQGIYILDSLQSAGASETSENISYLSLMKNNLHVLEQALN